MDGKPTIAIGIGLDTGEVVAGHVGSDKRLEFTLIGVPVNNSAYLSKVRPPRVLLSETTRDALTEQRCRCVDYEPMLLKGASETAADLPARDHRGHDLELGRRST